MCITISSYIFSITIVKKLLFSDYLRLKTFVTSIILNLSSTSALGKMCPCRKHELSLSDLRKCVYQTFRTG